LKLIHQGADNVNVRLIDVLVRRIRRKLKRQPSHPLHVKTVFGLGYTFDPSDHIPIDAETGEVLLESRLGWLFPQRQLQNKSGVRTQSPQAYREDSAQ